MYDRIPYFPTDAYFETGQDTCPCCGASQEHIGGALNVGYAGLDCDGEICWCDYCAYTWKQYSGEPKYIDGKFVFSNVTKNA
jgi:hypothetical protein